MAVSRNLVMRPAASRYPRPLASEPIGAATAPGCLLLEEGDKVRLAVLPGRARALEFRAPKPNERDYELYVVLPARKGAWADLLLPFVPTERTTVEREMALGYDGALRESDGYWSRVPPTAAVIETPEPYVNEAIRVNLKLAEIVAEKNPETGEYSALTGSIVYASMWPTPVTMLFHMALDPMGYHGIAARYLDIFKKRQGSSTPPGPRFQPHPSYLSAPRSLSSLDWLTDHGAILHSICEHALMSDDSAFIKDYLATILKACEFIRDARRIREHGGVAGLLPPASSTDRNVPEQSVWTDGWNYRGLTSAVRLLKRIGHPRAEEFEREAVDYKATFLNAFRQKAGAQPRWRDARGRPHPIVPTALAGRGDETHPFYLDAGPLFLVFAGLMDADDELMRTTCSFFREGPNTRVFDPIGHLNQPAVLRHEMSSCEPCYSWNVYHSHQLGDRQRFLEGMYSLFAGGLSQQTYVGCETRGGISGLNCTFALACQLARLAVVDDLLGPTRLHLLRLVPRAWLTERMETRFENMATDFGSVTVRFRLQDDAKTLAVGFQSRFHHPPDEIILDVPPIESLSLVIVNGRKSAAKPGERVRIPVTK
jgi:hypothetical protein